MNRFNEAQLDEIRKFKFSSLACIGFGASTEQKMHQYGFYVANPAKTAVVGVGAEETDSNSEIDNPLIDCTVLNQLDFEKWIDYSEANY